MTCGGAGIGSAEVRCCAVSGSEETSGWEIPVLSKTRAMLVIQQRFGSIERYPHSSSRSKPLYFIRTQNRVCKHDQYTIDRAMCLLCTHLMHSMSMRCCSAMLFSLLTFLCKAVNMLLRLSSCFPHSALICIRGGLALPCSSVAGKRGC